MLNVLFPASHFPHARLASMTLHRRLSGVTALIAVVLLLVPAMAWLQYRWVGQVSEAERERMQRTLRTAAAQFTTAFDSSSPAWSCACRWKARSSATGTGRPTPSATPLGPSARRIRSSWARCCSSTRSPMRRGRRRHRAAEARNVDRVVRPEQLRVRRWSSDLRTFEPAAWTDESSRSAVHSRSISAKCR